MTRSVLPKRTLTAGVPALVAHLIEVKHALSWHCARWAGRGPSLSVSISMAGMALEHEGHARALTSWLTDGADTAASTETITWECWFGGQRQPSLDWDVTIATLGATMAQLAPLWTVLLAAPDPRLHALLERITAEEVRQHDCLSELTDPDIRRGISLIDQAAVAALVDAVDARRVPTLSPTDAGHQSPASNGDGSPS